MTSPICIPIFANGPSGLTANRRKPAGLPPRISGTMRSDRLGQVSAMLSNRSAHRHNAHVQQPHVFGEKYFTLKHA